MAAVDTVFEQLGSMTRSRAGRTEEEDRRPSGASRPPLRSRSQLPGGGGGGAAAAEEKTSFDVVLTERGARPRSR